MHCKFPPQVFDTFWKKMTSLFSLYKCTGTQIWPWRNKVKSWLTTIIWTNVPDAIYQDSVPKLSWFWRRFLGVFLTYMGIAAILINGPWPFVQICNPHTPPPPTPTHTHPLTEGTTWSEVEENWLRQRFRGDVVQRCRQTTEILAQVS